MYVDHSHTHTYVYALSFVRSFFHLARLERVPVWVRVSLFIFTFFVIAKSSSCLRLLSHRSATVSFSRMLSLFVSLFLFFVDKVTRFSSESCVRCSQLIFHTINAANGIFLFFHTKNTSICWLKRCYFFAPVRILQ